MRFLDLVNDMLKSGRAVLTGVKVAVLNDSGKPVNSRMQLTLTLA
jgi:hypothetical protein